MTPQQLIEKMTKEGGAIVSSNSCSEIEIANARTTDRFAVNDDGLGYILRTPEWLRLCQLNHHALTSLAFFLKEEKVKDAEITHSPEGFSCQLSGWIGETPDGSCDFAGEIADAQADTLAAAIVAALEDVNWHGAK